MGIRMIGVDHTRASIDVRTIFSFTKKNIGKGMEAWKKIPGLHGCVIISTCNRIELWVSEGQEDGTDLDLFSLLAEEKAVDPEDYRQYVTERRDRQAVEHLFELACGLQSRVLGEDQIITQVKDALSLARENYATDNVLEVLFRMAVTAAKRVKTQAVIARGSSSAIHRAMEVLSQQGYSFEGKTCMVIGNGEMGKISATALEEQGGDVTVTVRRCCSGLVDIPRHCKRIDYGERMTLFPHCDYVVSATASPNYTLTLEKVSRALPKKPMVIIDLAVPRDVEPSVGKIPDITVFDIDSFGDDSGNQEIQQSVERAKEILNCQIEEFYDWYEGRELVERVQAIKMSAVEDFHLRTRKQLRDLQQAAGDGATEENWERFQEYMESAAGKVINKIMFGLRGNVSEETFRECMEAMEKIYG